MRIAPLLIPFLVAQANALVDLPAVSKVVSSALESLSAYTDFSAPASAPTPAPARVAAAPVADPAYWLKDIPKRGRASFNPNPQGYQVFRNVKDFGAKGDGVADDTAAINAAISAGGRCGPGVCDSSTITPAVVYFPAGTYIISTSIIDYYNTQIIGNPNGRAVLKATANFVGLGLIDGNQYQSNGNQGWISTNVFFRQIRNLVLDLTAINPATAATGIHWPTSQATSIQNVDIRMAVASNSQQQGLFIENGSGGWLNDVTITGGLYGANIGNQQFTFRNVVISGAVVGISQIWDWGWTYQGITIRDCGTAFSMIQGGSGAQNVGSVSIIDSTITNCPVFVDMVWTPTATPPAAGQLILENINLSNVPVAVRGPGGTKLAGSTGASTITAWGQGHRYTPNGPNKWQGTYSPATRAASLLASGSNRYYTKSKPQYGNVPVSSFVSIRASGATGDGSTDDTTAVQNAINSAAAAGKFLFFDHGNYKVTRTITIPPNSRIIGETYSVIIATGSLWADRNNPVPVVRVGKPGDTGTVEWSDMIVTTQGANPGALLIEWNLKASRGSGMWDVHTRIGGFRGSNQQVPQCPTGGAVTNNCLAAYMSMRITSGATGAYLENCWFWTADHDLDDARSTRVTVYTGRGLLVEGTDTYLYGTGVEHHSIYQYQFVNARNVVTTFIQTETPYWQPVPDVRNQPFPFSAALNDPNYANCQPGNCNALGLRILNSNNIYIYGAGLYSFFNNYDTTCSNAGGPENCQSQIFSVEGANTNKIWVYGLSTIGSQSMIVQDGTSIARYSDNVSVFPDTIALFTYRI